MTEHNPQSGGSRPPQSEKTPLNERLASPKAFLGILITAAAVWFIIANNTHVRIHLWVTWVSARMWVVLLITFLAGMLAGFLFSRRRVKRKRQREDG